MKPKEARETILELARDKGVKAEAIAKKMDYTHVNSFYRAINSPDTIDYIRLKKLAKSLGLTICELTDILK